MPRRALVLAGIVLALQSLQACKPLVRVHTRIVLPSGMSGSIGLLHVSVALGVSSSLVTAPPPGASTMFTRVEPRGAEFEAMYSDRVTQIWVQVTAWYDTNGNGLVDSGDATGSLPAPVHAVDRGACGNVTETPPIHLTLLR